MNTKLRPVAFLLAVACIGFALVFTAEEWAGWLVITGILLTLAASLL